MSFLFRKPTELPTNAAPMAQQAAQELAANDEAWREVSLSVSGGTPLTADARSAKIPP